MQFKTLYYSSVSVCVQCTRQKTKGWARPSVWLNSPWEAMFLSQTAADTASWSETEKKNVDHSNSPSPPLIASEVTPLTCPQLVKLQPFYTKHKKIITQVMGRKKRLKLVALLGKKETTQTLFFPFLHPLLIYARHANSSSSHTKPPLSVAATNYLGEEGQGK